MRRYHFNEFLFMNKGKVLSLENEDNKTVGSIEKTDISGCEKGHSFSLTLNDGTTTMIGIKKRGIKNFLTATYVIKTEDTTYMLKDKAGDNLLYFCILGEIDGKSIRIEENWQNEIEVKIERLHIATIKKDEFSLKSFILIEDDFAESSTFFAITVLMYFMHKIYKNESSFIESLLFD